MKDARERVTGRDCPASAWIIGCSRRCSLGVAVLLLTFTGCGPAPQTFREDQPAAETHPTERKDERREERHERKERRREGRDGHENEAGPRDHEGRRDGAPSRSAGGGAGGASAIGAGAYDLERDERMGGHTLAKHVGRSDEQLRERLTQEPNISAASTWTNTEAAEATVGEGLRQNAVRIADWQNRGERRANLALHYDAGREIGRSIRRGGTTGEPCTAAVIVLKAQGLGGFYVLTTYPEATR